MKVSNFLKLPESSPHIGEAKAGEYFLQGEKMIKQKVTKKLGDEVSMYKIIDVNDNSYLIIAHYEKLEE